MTDLERIAHELRTANLIAYHAQLDFMGAQAKALRAAIITALNEGH